MPERTVIDLILNMISLVGVATVFYITMAIMFELFNYDYANIIIPILHH